MRGHAIIFCAQTPQLSRLPFLQNEAFYAKYSLDKLGALMFFCIKNQVNLKSSIITSKFSSLCTKKSLYEFLMPFLPPKIVKETHMCTGFLEKECGLQIVFL